MKPAFALATLAVFATTARAETDFTKLTDEERAVFHTEIRAVLSASPELLGQKQPAPLFYEDAIASDLELIQRWSEDLFADTLPGFGAKSAKQRITLFTRTDCSPCARARQELAALSKQYDLRVNLVDANSHSELVGAIGADTLPFYVFPRMMLRGHMPKPVLDRYLANRTGQ